MRGTVSTLPDVFILETDVLEDARGSFSEVFHAEKFSSIIGRKISFIQDNQSQSRQGVLRGLHYQVRHPQAKLVRVLRGEIYDVAVDLRPKSLHFGRWVGVTLSETNRKQLFIPEGFAHGFLVLSERADVVYKISDRYDPTSERCLRWNDTKVGISWPLTQDPLLSPKDAAGTLFDQLELADV